ncbi:TIGR00725 family protein [Candidatus Nomurabacteria bacterium]|nr:TIGR00725 family protein [Candidatus Nomurabacteria bacterium]
MKKLSKKLQIGVLGWAGVEEYPAGSGPTNEELEMAREIGYLLAKAEAIVVTGGKGGVMRYAAQGVKEKGGTTVGVITGPRCTSNKWTDIEIVTGAKIAGLEEVFIPLMCDAVIVVGGGAGTLQEICVSYRNKIPIIVIEKTFGWAKKILKENYLDSRKTVKIVSAKNPKDAVEKAIKQARIKWKN